ncbi:hypothetical protein [Streptomyces sp. NPDC002573]|uniref:hypothetical protein n=1 Tax=Streptomyces sp. NPDC002573 TaxID=3364651 RepID=UPI00369976AA
MVTASTVALADNGTPSTPKTGTLFRDVTAERIAALDAAVPAAAVVALPARDPERILRPRERETPVPENGRGADKKASARRLPVWFILLVVAEVVLGLGFLVAVLTGDPAHLAWYYLLRAVIPTIVVVRLTRRAYHRATSGRR